MKKVYSIIAILCLLFAAEYFRSSVLTAQSNTEVKQDESSTNSSYIFPKFYKGIYLNVGSARNISKLKKFVNDAQNSSINTFVLDVQSSRYKKCIVPSENVKYLKDNRIHPIARIVVFPAGLKYYPIPENVILDKLDIAESACKAGFHEIQFDYIRFNDSSALRHISKNQRYQIVEGFLDRAKKHLKKYDVKIAADVFGRIPLNRSDIIGQRMEGLDKVVDLICPMAYPSHYWTNKLRNNPYHTVYITSHSAKKRTQNAEIVTYIQAFKWKMPRTMTFTKYIQDQIKAVHDSKIKGFILWNARQDYFVPMKAAKNFYEQNSKITELESGKQKDIM